MPSAVRYIHRNYTQLVYTKVIRILTVEMWSAVYNSLACDWKVLPILRGLHKRKEFQFSKMLTPDRTYPLNILNIVICEDCCCIYVWPAPFSRCESICNKSISKKVMGYENPMKS